MSHFNVSQLRPVLVNSFIDESNSLNSTWTELSQITWLLSQKHKNGENKSWDQLSSKDYLYFRAARNARKQFGMPAITDNDLADYLKDLKPWKNGVNNSAANMAFDRLLRNGIDPTDENKKRELDRTLPIAEKAEQARVDDAKACFDELLELINGNFDAKAENHPDYPTAFKRAVDKINEKIYKAFLVAYVKFSKVIEESIKPAEITEAEDLLEQLEQIITADGGSIDLLKRKAAKYAQGAAMFNQFF